MTPRRILCLACVVLGLVGPAFSATSPQFLRQVVEGWLGDRDNWAFTQKAVEYENGVRYERIERFDPRKTGNARWELLQVNGKTPTPEQRRDWADRKFKRHPRNLDTPIADFFDFKSAKVLAETPELIRLEVPLNQNKLWLFPVDKVGVRVTLNKQTHALQQLSAQVREPFKVLLGVAKVNKGELNLDFINAQPAGAEKGGVQPAGTAWVSVMKLGERVDFTWSDFTRVEPRAVATRGGQATTSGAGPVGFLSEVVAAVEDEDP